MNPDKVTALSDARERYIYACVGGMQSEIQEAKEAISRALEMEDNPKGHQ